MDLDVNALAQHLQQLEEELLQSHIRSNPESVAAYLADDFREFGSSGRIFSGADILNALAAEPGRGLSLTDFACTLLAPGVAHVTYRSVRAQPHGLQSICLRSSLWVHRSGHWQILFHQGTKL